MTTIVEYVPNAPFRERYLHLKRTEGMTTGELAHRLGWDHHGSRRVDRVLGLSAAISHGKSRIQSRVSYEIAVQLAEVLGLDPYECGV